MLTPSVASPDPRALRGAGLAFPFAVDPQGKLATAQAETKIEQAIWLILSTAKRERVMRPDYGCELHRLIFSPNDDTTAGLAIHYVRRAVERWEPRIEILRLEAGRNEADPGRLEVLDARQHALGELRELDEFLAVGPLRDAAKPLHPLRDIGLEADPALLAVIGAIDSNLSLLGDDMR